MNESSGNDRPFEESLAELEQVVRDLEEGRLGLDEALTRYEAGVRLIKQCHSQLQQAEQRILLLTQVEAEDRPVLQPFKHESTLQAAHPELNSRPTGSPLIRRRPAGER